VISAVWKWWKNNLTPVEKKIFITTLIFTTAALGISFGAQRFILLCVVPLSILFLFGVNDIIKLSDKLQVTGDKNIVTRYALLVTVVFSCLCIIPKIIASEQQMPQLLNPIYNDTWNNALTYIKANTPEDAIINSWWPPGHFIKAMANRRVTFDGATINNHQGYWLANALLARSEDEALDYFRLLNNSGNQAVDLLLKSGMTDPETVAFLKKIIREPKLSAQAQAQQILGDKADQLISLTHGMPASSYLLVYNEMIQNLILYPFVARWDFQKAERLNADPKLRKTIPSSRSTDQYVDFLWSIVGGQPRVSGILAVVDQQGSKIMFREGLTCDMEQKVCSISSSRYGHGAPAFLFYQDGDNVIKKPQPNANLPYSIVIGQRYGKYEAMLLETPLAESLLVRLYFFRDAGLKHIKLVHQDANLTRQTQIDVFRIGDGALFF
jgi:hypothetical protein